MPETLLFDLPSKSNNRARKSHMMGFSRRLRSYTLCHVLRPTANLGPLHETKGLSHLTAQPLYVASGVVLGGG